MRALAENRVVAIGAPDGEAELLDAIDGGSLEDGGQFLRADIAPPLIEDVETISGAELGEKSVRLLSLGCCAIGGSVGFVLKLLKWTVPVETLGVVLGR